MYPCFHIISVKHTTFHLKICNLIGLCSIGTLYFNYFAPSCTKVQTQSKEYYSFYFKCCGTYSCHIICFIANMYRICFVTLLLQTDTCYFTWSSLLTLNSICHIGGLESYQVREHTCGWLICSKGSMLVI